MVTIQNIDYTLFNQGMAGLVRATKKNSQVVIAKEMGELVKTLVRISPPKEPRKTKDSIRLNFHKKFSALDRATGFEDLDKEQSSTGLKWYGANSKYLFGGAPDSDLRESSQKTLLGVYYRVKNVQGHHRIIVPFKNRKTRQRVAILTRVLTTPEKIAALVKRVQAHVGRLKAGWLAAVRDGAIKITGAYKPPKYVTDHMNAGLRGRYEDRLRDEKNPSFLIANSAKGITNRYTQFLIQSAVTIRAKAMVRNAALYLKGKKKLADYATSA